MLVLNILHRIHLFISADLGDAITKPPQDQAYLTILFIALLVSLGGLFVTEGPAGHLIIIYVLIPIIFFPARFQKISLNSFQFPMPSTFSLYNVFRNFLVCRTPLFLSVVIYGVDKAILSYFYPEPIHGYIHIFFYYLLVPLLAFIMAIIRLSVDRPNFFSHFFKMMAPIVALNALINIILFLEKIINFPDEGLHRLQSKFGAAMGYNPNYDALIHSVYFVGCLIAIINKIQSRNEKLIYCTISIILLFSIIWEQSRSSYLALIITLIIYFKKLNLKKMTLFVTGMIALTGLISAFLINGRYNYLAPQLIRTDYLQIDYFRIEIWAKFFELAKQNLFIGVGDRYVFSVMLNNGTIITHAHSIFLTSLVRGGIIGLLLIVYIFVAGTLRTYQYAVLRNDFIPFCVLLSVFISGFFDFEIKLWQSGWYLAGYWVAISLMLGADASLRSGNTGTLTQGKS